MAAVAQLQTIRALSRYRPFEGGGTSVKEAHEDLILAALAEAGGHCESVQECRDTVKTLFRVDLAELSVAAALNTLVRDERVTHVGSSFQLASDEALRLEEVAAESQTTADAAIADFRSLLNDVRPMTHEELTLLVQHLVLYLRTVLRRHGAEASMLLYPDAPPAQELYAELEEEGFDFLPRIDDRHLRDARDFALSEFIRRPTEAQKAYLGQNLNTAYFLTVLSIDPEGARLVSEITAGQVVYLDTNFIYRLLGVQGPRYVKPAEAILQTTQGAGYECRLTPWTLNEFRMSLKRSRDFIERYPVLPTQYAEIAAAATSDENFVSEYWRRVRSGIKPADFFDYYDEVETHLRGLEVNVVKAGCTAVDQQEDTITDEMSILARASSGRFRHPALLEHDAKHRLLIERLRGQGNRNFSNAGFWFLTHDTVLPRYDRMAATSKSALPFCVSAGAWYQIVEAFRPKTDDIELSLSDMLASPYVRYRRKMSQKLALEVVARVSQFADGTPELATRVLMNSAGLTEIEAAETPDETAEKIDNAIIAAAREVQEDARRAREIAEQERQRADDTAAEAQRRAAQIEDEAARAIQVAAAAQEDELERARLRAEEQVRLAEERAQRALDEQQRVHADELEKRDAALAGERTRVTDARRNLYFFAGAVAIVVLFTFALVLGLALAWAFLTAIAVVVGLGVALSQWARWRSERHGPQ